MKDRVIGQEAIPAARTSDLVRTETLEDVLVYDQTRHQVHHLNATVVTVLDACNGRRTVADLSQVTSLPEETVALTIRKLAEANLLESPLPFSLDEHSSRRSWVKKAAVTAAAVPIIATVSAPAASAQTSSDTKNPPKGDVKGP